MARLLLVLAIALCGIPVQAKDFTQQLGGLTQVYVFVAPLDAEAAACGLVGGATLRDAIVRPIRERTKLRVVDSAEAESATLSLTISTVSNDGSCAHYIEFEVVVHEEIKLRHRRSPSLQKILLWEASDMLRTSGLSATSPRVRARVEEMAKTFAAAWQSSNP